MLTRGVHVGTVLDGGWFNIKLWRNTINLVCASAIFTLIVIIITIIIIRTTVLIFSVEWNVSGLFGIRILTMEIENIVANTVLLKAREGKPHQGEFKGGNEEDRTITKTRLCHSLAVHNLRSSLPFICIQINSVRQSGTYSIVQAPFCVLITLQCQRAR